MPDEARLIFLPGLGADARLFVSQRASFPHAEFQRLPAPSEGEEFGDYAKRWAESIEWTPGHLVVGFAFGGVLALEAAARHEGFRKACGALVLVSSCRSHDAVTADFRRQVALSRMIPQMMQRRLLMCFAERFSPEDDLSGAQRQLLKDMAAELNLDHLRWASRACCEWQMEGTEQIEADLRVFQVHGEKDSVIPLVRKDVDFVVPNAGHLLQYTHGGELDAYIRKCARAVGLALA